MTARLRSVTRIVTSGLLTLGLAVGLPIVLVSMTGSPLAMSIPSLQRLVTSVVEGDLDPDGLLLALVLVIWVLWVLFVPAVLWEIAVQLSSTRVRHRRVPSVLRPLTGLVSRLVAGWLTVSLTLHVASDPTAASIGRAKVELVDDLNRGADVRLAGTGVMSGASHSPSFGGTGHANDPDAVETALETTLVGVSAFVSAGVLLMIGQRRRYRLAHRLSGIAGGRGEAGHRSSVDAAERSLRRSARVGDAHWVTAALRSLAASVDGPARPIFVDIGPDFLEATFVRAPVVSSPAGWQVGDDGLILRLPRSTPIAELAPAATTRHSLSAVAVSDRLLVDLYAVGALHVVGPMVDTEPMLRSVIYELLFSTLAEPCRLLCLESSVPADLHPLVEVHSPATLSAALASSIASSSASKSPIVVVGERRSVGLLLPAIESSRRSGISIAMVTIGESSESIESGWCLTVYPDTALLEPLDRAIAPTRMSTSGGGAITDLLAHADQPPLHAQPTGGDGPIMVKVLGEISIEGASWNLTSQQLSLVAFLACVGTAGRSAIVDALWDGQPISSSRFLNLLAEVRAKIGRQHLPESVGGRYCLVGIDTDLARFEAGLSRAEAAPELAEQNLRQIMELVTGVPFQPPGSRYWSWVDDQAATATRAEVLIADAAAQMAERSRAGGDLDQARRACVTGLLAAPFDEGLVTTLAEIYIELGQPGPAQRTVESWEAKVARLGCGPPSTEPRRRLQPGRSPGPVIAAVLPVRR